MRGKEGGNSKGKRELSETIKEAGRKGVNAREGQGKREWEGGKEKDSGEEEEREQRSGAREREVKKIQIIRDKQHNVMVNELLRVSPRVHEYTSIQLST